MPHLHIRLSQATLDFIKNNDLKVRAILEFIEKEYDPDTAKEYGWLEKCKPGRKPGQKSIKTPGKATPVQKKAPICDPNKPPPRIWTAQEKAQGYRN